MTALLTLITAFFVLVVVYLALSIVLSGVGWWLAFRAGKTGDGEGPANVGRKIDRLKDKAFVISLTLTFFFVAPFIVIYFFLKP